MLLHPHLYWWPPGRHCCLDALCVSPRCSRRGALRAARFHDRGRPSCSDCSESRCCNSLDRSHCPMMRLRRCRHRVRRGATRSGGGRGRHLARGLRRSTHCAVTHMFCGLHGRLLWGTCPCECAGRHRACSFRQVFNQRRSGIHSFRLLDACTHQRATRSMGVSSCMTACVFRHHVIAT